MGSFQGVFRNQKYEVLKECVPESTHCMHEIKNIYRRKKNKAAEGDEMR